MTKKSKIALGLVAAVGAGVIIGLLVAPEKTKKLGKKLKNAAGGWKGSLDNLFSKAKDGLHKKDLARNTEGIPGY